MPVLCLVPESLHGDQFRGVSGYLKAKRNTLSDFTPNLFNSIPLSIFIFLPEVLDYVSEGKKSLKCDYSTFLK